MLPRNGISAIQQRTAFATSALPTPVSPVMKTGKREGATLRTSVRNRCMHTDVPISNDAKASSFGELSSVGVLEVIEMP